MNVVDLAKEIGIGTQKVIDFVFKYYKESTYSINTVLKPYQIEKTRKKFENFVAGINIELETGKFLAQIEKDIFRNRLSTRIIYPHKMPIDSIFSDREAKKLCKKMANPQIRFISNNFLINSPQPLYKYQLHFLAMKAIAQFGSNMVSFIYNLNSLPTQSNDLIITNMEMDIKAFNPKITFPAFVFNSDNHGKIYIKINRSSKNSNFLSTISIFDSTTTLLHQYSSSGDRLNEMCKQPIKFLLFTEMTKNGAIFYSGYDDGQCQLCGRKLTDSISVAIQMGPICRLDHF